MAQILLVEARFYPHITDLLVEGAQQWLVSKGHSVERFAVPGALEIPAVIAQAHAAECFDGYVALGCVIRGETSHYDTVCNESARGLMQLCVDHLAAIGNGILTVENEAQALERAHPGKGNKGAGAAQACLAILEAQQKFLSIDPFAFEDAA